MPLREQDISDCEQLDDYSSGSQSLRSMQDTYPWLCGRSWIVVKSSAGGGHTCQQSVAPSMAFCQGKDVGEPCERAMHDGWQLDDAHNMYHAELTYDSSRPSSPG